MDSTERILEHLDLHLLIDLFHLLFFGNACLEKERLGELKANLAVLKQRIVSFAACLIISETR